MEKEGVSGSGSGRVGVLGFGALVSLLPSFHRTKVVSTAEEKKGRGKVCLSIPKTQNLDFAADHVHALQHTASFSPLASGRVRVLGFGGLSAQSDG